MSYSSTVHVLNKFWNIEHCQTIDSHTRKDTTATTASAWHTVGRRRRRGKSNDNVTLAPRKFHTLAKNARSLVMTVLLPKFYYINKKKKPKCYNIRRTPYGILWLWGYFHYILFYIYILYYWTRVAYVAPVRQHVYHTPIPRCLAHIHAYGTHTRLTTLLIYRKT